MARMRLDQLLVERGLAPSRAAAQAMLLAGEVELEGRRPSLKPGNLVQPDVAAERARRPRWASRAGDKLAAALDAFGVDVDGRDGAGRRRVDGRIHRCPARSRRCARLRGRRRRGAADRPPARGIRAWSCMERTNLRTLERPAGADRPRHAGPLLHLAAPGAAGRAAPAGSREAAWSRWSSRNSRPARGRCRAAASYAIHRSMRRVLRRFATDAGDGGLRRPRPDPVAGHRNGRQRRVPGAPRGSRRGWRRRRWSSGSRWSRRHRPSPRVLRCATA